MLKSLGQTKDSQKLLEAQYQNIKAEPTLVKLNLGFVMLVCSYLRAQFPDFAVRSSRRKTS